MKIERKAHQSGDWSAKAWCASGVGSDQQQMSKAGSARRCSQQSHGRPDCVRFVSHVEIFVLYFKCFLFQESTKGVLAEASGICKFSTELHVREEARAEAGRLKGMCSSPRK